MSATAPRPEPDDAPRAAPAPVVVRAPARERRGPRVDWAPLALLCAVPIGLTLFGWRYYTAPLGERLRHPLHLLLRPAGPVGLSLGIAGLALFLFLWAYAVRRKYRALAWTGGVGAWLRVHVVAGLAIPLIVAVHAGWRFDGLIGLGYFAMLAVALSGIVGRYLYTHIPRTRSGLEMSLEEVSAERRALLTDLAAATGLEPAVLEQALAADARPYAGLDPVRTLLRLAQEDLGRRRRLAQLKRAWARPRPGRTPLDPRALASALRLAQHEMKLAQQVRMLDATRRVFGLWHVAHRPFATTALIAVLVHVIVAVVVGGVGLPGGPGR